MIYQLSICNELSIPSHYQQTPNRIVEASKSLRDAGHRSTHLSHAKQALYHLSYIPVPFKLWSSFWTKSMIYQLSICNELSIFSFCQPEQNRIVEASKMFGDAGHRSPYLSHAKQALYRLSYIPVPFKLWASFWTKSMIYQLSICNELSIPSHYQQTPNRIVEASKTFGDAGHRSPYLSHAKQALYRLSYIPVPFKLWAIFWTKAMYISFRFVTSCQFFPFVSQKKNRIVEASKMFGDAGHRSPYLSHAKQALYRLSYIPVPFKLWAIFWTKAMYISFRFVTSCRFLPFISKHHIDLSKPQKVLEMRGTDPRTSRMQSERSAVSATFPYSSSFELASEQNPWYISFRFVTSCQFLPIISKHQIELSKPQKLLEMRGIDPRTSRMRSKRSTVWATSPYPSSFELSSEQKPCISAFDL